MTHFCIASRIALCGCLPPGALFRVVLASSRSTRTKKLGTLKLDGIRASKGDLRLAEVHIQDGETLESALRRFKRKVLQEEIIRDIKRHTSYLKPGEKKRVKAALARKRNRKKRSRDSAMGDQTR